MRYSNIYRLILPIIILASTHCIATEDSPPNWTYDDDLTGQEDWGSIKGYEICRSGTNQSPIIISFTKTTALPSLNLKYKQTDGVIKLTDKSFVIEIEKGETIIDDGKSYSLKSIEIHSPSGHRIKEVIYPVEIHLIHKTTAGDILIIAAFANIGEENSAIATILKHTASHSTNKFKLDINALIPNTQSYYAYSGSLPYPPCTENTQWRIFKTPITISKPQFSSIAKYTGRNTRLPQPLYMREVLETQP